MSTALSTTELSQVSGLLAAVPEWLDKALLIEKEIGMGNIYAMISNGQAVERIAASLHVTSEQMKFFLTRTPKHRRDYMNAKAFKQAEDSMEVIGTTFKKSVFMEKEESNAVKHHNTIIDRAMGVLNKSDDVKGSEPIVVNNTVIVRDSDDVAPLPTELKDIIEGDFENASP